ncbi:AGE family epimerase/isomerase [Ferruginibacter sp. SUN106]|uniref:AGE family epimerase/isomerase n=1 Tax=Ferruginibacter sp. SUN106 TaxID=2978348 RepID=UPI003D35D890
MKINLSEYKAAMQDELKAILSFWMKYTVDESNGGFVGRIDFNNKIINEAPKGAVLNARILWSFSAAYNLTGNKTYLEFAQRAFHYINTYFIDKDHRGVYWSVDHKGKPLDTKKQIYAQAFTIYAFSEFYKATNDQTAIIEAIDLYDVINKYSYDTINGGYTEAFTKEWKTLNDLRLSDKDANEKKSMNTHLHLLEAFTTLYKIWRYEPVKKKIAELSRNFLQYIIDPSTHHQYLFFDEQWQPKSATISYGHDIETAWLLQEAAEVIEDEDLMLETKLLAVKISDAVRKGLDNDGGLWYEYEPATEHLIKEKHMWPQAEAMVGYFNAYQNTNDESYLDSSIASWQFVQQYIHDKQNGEWLWGIKENYESMQEDKVGIWKCPYHNSRACIEIIKRINHLEK